jgi:hypothetical protein
VAESRVKVHIWNRALSRIGHTVLVQSETEETAAAEACRTHWDDCVREAIEVADWDFAIKQATLAQPDGVTRVGWEYVYTLPADCARPIALLAEGQRIGTFTGGTRNPFRVMADDDKHGRVLCSDLDADAGDFDVLEYVAYHEHIVGWPAQFIDALAWRLAAELALAIPKDAAKANMAWGQFYRSLSRASAQSLQRSQRDPEPDPPSVAVRDE